MPLPTISQVVPVLDLSQPEEDVAKVCRTACEDHGFFFITNTGIASKLISDHAAAQRQFFQLSDEQKRTILADSNNRGYTPLSEETLDPSKSTQGDAKEGLYFGRDIPPSSPEAALPLHGPNQWPDPALLPGYREIVEEYLNSMYSLGIRMLPILSLALELPRDYLEQFFKKPMIFLRPLRYAPVVSNEEQGQHAAGQHSDYGMLTILWTDGSPGLQIHYKEQWVDVAVPENLLHYSDNSTDGGGDGNSDDNDVFIVNLGDMLERWTAGKFKSTVHRVVNPHGRERYSCPFFFEPSPDAVVAPLPGCKVEVDASENREKYAPISPLEYLLGRYAATHEDYAQKMKRGDAKIYI
jgi:isopenicillin N synthase-like dioxygenase